ncbi:hypothetical protein PV327_011196, partial [Microctonus hyperodae]
MEFHKNYRNKSSSRVKCDVPESKSRMDINLELSFHKIPKPGVIITRVNFFRKTEKADQRSEWLRLLKIEKKEKITLYMCSLHFTPDEYYFPEYQAQKQFLRKNALPIPANIPIQKKISIDERARRVIHRQEQESVMEIEKRMKNTKSSDLQTSVIKKYTVNEFTAGESQLQDKEVNAVDSIIKEGKLASCSKEEIKICIEERASDDSEINIVGHDSYEPLMTDAASATLSILCLNTR